MIRTPVVSSNIAAIGYDADSKILEIEFKNGTVYHYHAVPFEAFTDLVAAKSIGSHFHKHIRNAHLHTPGEHVVPSNTTHST